MTNTKEKINEKEEKIIYTLLFILLCFCVVGLLFLIIYNFMDVIMQFRLNSMLSGDYKSYHLCICMFELLVIITSSIFLGVFIVNKTRRNLVNSVICIFLIILFFIFVIVIFATRPTSTSLYTLSNENYSQDILSALNGANSIKLCFMLSMLSLFTFIFSYLLFDKIRQNEDKIKNNNNYINSFNNENINYQATKETQRANKIEEDNK